MNSTTVRRLEDLRMADALEVGGKAASLGELLAAGVRVPEGVVMTADAAARTPPERRWDIAAGAWDLGPGPFAVRSSGISEDGVDRSFAGMYETVLGVSIDGLGEATDRVLVSGQAARVAGYAPAGAGGLAGDGQRQGEPDPTRGLPPS